MNISISHILSIAAIVLTAASVTSCVKEEEFANSPEGNFEMLWKIMDEHYCFFEYKDIDWQAVHDNYARRITPDMPSKALFEVLGEMLAELQDGHVNLYAAHDVASYRKWYEDYPSNFNDSIADLYLGKTGEYQTASGLRYKAFSDNIGYIRYESFNDGIGEGNLSEGLNALASCDGLIIDVRNNGGGSLDNARRLASRFTEQRVLTGYIQHKTGPGHGDFSAPAPVWLEPSPYIRWQKPVIVLVNRHSYSATNDFVNMMRILPRVTIMGDKTGGGSGLPFSAELPNSWSVRFSASPTLDAGMQQIEFGIDPDVSINMTIDDIRDNRDTIIEAARAMLRQG